MTNETSFGLVEIHSVIETHMDSIGVSRKDKPTLDDFTDLLIATATAQRAETLRNVVVFLYDLSKWNVILHPIIERIDELLRTELRDAAIDIKLKR